MIKSTCIDASELGAKGDLILKLASYHEPPGHECAASDCPPSGKVVIRRIPKGLYKAIQKFKCFPLAKKDSNIPLNEWKECYCLLYTYVKGGEETVRKVFESSDIKRIK
ncbi:MAG: hypothetical protein AAF518_14710 [Spirochaetota bacterium]